MMIRCKTFLAISLLSISCALFGDQNKVIELNDGSRITGRILSMKDGVYTVESHSLGKIQLPDSEILSIRSGSQSPAPANGVMGTPSPRQGLESVQQQMLQNPDTVNSIMALQSDPLVQSILNDPEIMGAIQSGNIDMLSENPKIQQLMSHPTIQQIQGTY